MWYDGSLIPQEEGPPATSGASKEVKLAVGSWRAACRLVAGADGGVVWLKVRAWGYRVEGGVLGQTASYPAIEWGFVLPGACLRV